MNGNKQIAKFTSGRKSWFFPILGLVISLILPCLTVLSVHAAGCPDGSILFREDFGGNQVEDPVAKGTGIPECTDYTYDDNPVDYNNEGKYSIRKVGYDQYLAWNSNIIDHTYPNDKHKGYFMQVDASEHPCEFYHIQIDKVCEGSELYFSLYGTSSTRKTSNANATIKIIVENATTGAEIDHLDIEMENSNNGVWEQYGLSVTVPNGCQAINYRIINNADPNTSQDGNDFCLDDIEVHACVPQPSISPKKGTELCIGESETLTADLDNTSNLMLPITYTWYKCTTQSYKSEDWVKVHEGREMLLNNVELADAGYYKVLATGADQNVDINACSCLSEFYILNIVDCGSQKPQICPNGTLLFKEDFGGNSENDPSVKKEAISQCTYEFGEDPRDSNGFGKYSIRKVGVLHSQWYKNIYDHTYPDDGDRGYFMQVDASATSGIFYQTEITDLCENSELNMSMWGMSSTTTSGWGNAYLKLIVEDKNGNVLESSDIELENGKGFWEQFVLCYTIPSGQNSVIFKIINNSNTSWGNDFCLDDIEVRLCNPPITVDSPDSLCPGSDISLTADFVNDGTYAEPVTLTWYKCDTISYEPSDWTQAGSGTSLDLHNITAADEGYYRVWASGNGSSQLISKCNSASDFAKINLKVCESCTDTSTELLDSVALGDAYTRNGFNIPAPSIGENVDTLYLKGARGCDSIVSLKLFVYENTNDSIHASICPGESFQQYGFNESATGIYTQRLKNRTGGDSLVTLVLELLPTYDDTITQTINEGDSYLFAGNTYNTEGLYTASLKSINGCDSIVTLRLNVLKGTSDTIRAAICAGESFQQYGFDESTAGTFTQQLQNAAGTDSLVTLVLELLPTYDDTITQTISEGDSYQFAGNTYNTEGLYTASLKSINGCDSIVTLKLNVLKGTSDTIRAAICAGESFQQYGFDESTAGTFTQQLQNAAGTDSLVTLVLELLPTYDDTITQTISEGGSYQFAGNTYNTEGLYTASLKSINGCDSIVTLKLNVLKGTSDTIRATICAGESFQQYGFDESTAGTFTQQLQNAAGTDSLVTLVLELLPTYDDTITQTISEGSSYQFAGNTYNTEGLYTASLKSINGCDSIVTLKLNVLKGTSDTIRAAICAGESFQQYGFDESTAGTFTQQLQNAAGTDSLVTLVLELLPTYDDTITQTISEGGSYQFAGNTYNTEGLYTASLKSINGCDSIVTLKLNVLKGTSDTIRAAICAGESFQQYGFDESTAGTFTQQLQNAAGTDSLVTLVLELLPTYDDTITQTINEGGSYQFAGNTYNTEGLYTASLKSINGCDSIVTLKLNVLKGTSDTIRAAICAGESFQQYGFDESTAGTFTQQLQNAAGTDSLVTLVLELLPTYNDTIIDEFCAGESYTQHGFNVNKGGTHLNELKSVQGCDSIIVLILNELPVYTESFNDTICEGEDYQKNGFDLIRPEEGTTTHTLSFLPVYGCDSMVTLQLHTLPLRESSEEHVIKQGTAFTLNGKRYKEEGTFHQFRRTTEYCEDISITIQYEETVVERDTFHFVEIIPAEILIRGGGSDNRWHVENIELYPQAVVSIYDRWGKKLFEHSDYNDETGWDGTYNGYDMPSTDYWYLIDVHEIDRVYVGHFTLIRN